MTPLIIGAGPAGTAAAITLARARHHPLLLERDPHATEKVCGEFLAHDAADTLAALGLHLPALGAVPIRHAVFGAGRRRAALDLPFPAWGLPRATLDAALLGAARDAGAELRLGTAVTEATPHTDAWRLRLATGEVLHAPHLILATGKHELRGLRRSATGGAIGLKLPLLGEAPEATIALLACPGGYAGLQPRPGGGANLCAALDPRAPGVAEAARGAEAFLAHVANASALAAHLLRALAPELPKPLAVAGIPYGFLHRGPGPYRVGDQAAVIPSFCGDGVAMALRSGAHAAAAIAAGHPPATHHAAWAASVRRGMRLAGALSALTTRAPRVLVTAVAASPRLTARVARSTRLGA